MRSLIFLAVLILTNLAGAQLSLPPTASELTLDKGLMVDGVAQYGRRPINKDAVVAGLADGTIDLRAVKAGDVVTPDHAWKEVAAEAGGFGASGPSSYILVRVNSEQDRVMLLEATGHAMVYVNGEPRMGDPYGAGYASLPVALRAGENTFLFVHASRGGLKAALRQPASELMIGERDLTLPDVLIGDGDAEALLGVPVTNASTATRRVVVRCETPGSVAWFDSFTLPPCSFTKLPLAMRVGRLGGAEQVAVSITASEGDKTLATREVKLVVVPSRAKHKRTFVSRVDGSVQYAAFVPPTAASPAPPSGATITAPGLVLSLHGASVEAPSQAAAYAPRADTVIACPTNRRPYGFDWEDWGRIDALEVLELTRGWFKTDPAKQHLTGHSMGGHGTWNIGVLCADRFAAIAPSAGWLSFDSYANARAGTHNPDTAIGQAFQAARATSMTLDFMENLRGKGVYILHGDADDNVPVGQARAGKEALEKLGIPCGYHEEPGAGHWWGSPCVDWPGIWETFAAARLQPGSTMTVKPPLDERGFVTGSFKRVFDRGFALVYSTGGTAEENAWSYAKARFDAEQWWYRGNGYARVMADAEFLTSPTAGNVVIYGNSQSNLAWTSLVADGDLRVTRTGITLAGKTIEGEDLVCLAAVARKGGKDRLVGVVGGTGLKGMRSTDRLPYFLSGTGFPGTIVTRSSVWREGFGGVEAATGADGAVVWK